MIGWMRGSFPPSNEPGSQHTTQRRKVPSRVTMIDHFLPTHPLKRPCIALLKNSRLRDQWKQKKGRTGSHDSVTTLHCKWYQRVGKFWSESEDVSPIQSPAAACPKNNSLENTAGFGIASLSSNMGPTTEGG